MFVYLVSNLVNGKTYIGQTTYEDPSKRWGVHKSLAKSGSDGCPKLMRAMRKHGIENFSFEVLGSAPDQVALDELEVKYIQQYDSISSGYNVKEGGARGKHSDETKAQMSATRLANPELCKTRLGSTVSDETKAKMSATHKKLGTKPPPHSPEKLSAIATERNKAYKGKPRPWSVNRERPISVDGVEYSSVAAAALALGAEKTTLHRNLRHPPTSKRKPKYDCKYL